MQIVTDIAERSMKILLRTEIKHCLLIKSKCQKKHGQSNASDKCSEGSKGG